MEIGNLLKKHLKTLSIVVIVLVTALTRLIPHPPNFTPVAAIALFAGANLNKKTAFIIPLSAMFLSDLFLGLHSTMPYVYGSFLIIILIGHGLKRKSNFRNLFLSSLTSSILFFLITNFGVWITSGMYLKNFNGLATCYLLGLPFLKNTFFGDLFYTFTLFYGYQYFVFGARKIYLLRKVSKES